MKYATISWTFGLDDTNKLFESVKTAGFDSLQYCGDHKVYNPTEVRALAQKHSIQLLAYDPFNCKPKTAEDATLEKCIQWYIEIMDFAETLGVPMVTIQGLSNWTLNQTNYESAIQFLIRAVSKLDKEAQKRQLLMTYESCNHYEVPWVHTADELLRIKQESGATNLQFVLDSFHMNINEKDPKSAITSIGKDLYSYHVSDSGRGGYGSGQVDFTSQKKALDQINFEGPIFFEIVLPDIRPYKFPMTKEQMKLLIETYRNSISKWESNCD